MRQVELKLEVNGKIDRNNQRHSDVAFCLIFNRENFQEKEMIFPLLSNMVVSNTHQDWQEPR